MAYRAIQKETFPGRQGRYLLLSRYQTPVNSYDMHGQADRILHQGQVVDNILPIAKR
jgi:hypothetical protein